MNNNYLIKLKKAELEILDEIDRVCNKNNIQYFLMFGTLLGAVRHDGFIPWDDDIDIGMLRDDYDKFIEIAPKELKGKFTLDYITTNKNYYMPFVKVRNSKTRFEEKSTINYNGPKGIWVDIFPYNYCEYDKVNFYLKFKSKLLFLMYATLTYKNLHLNNNSFKVKLCSKLFSNKTIFNIIDKLSVCNKKTEKIVYYNFRGLKHVVIFDKNEIFDVKKITFENKKYYAPKHNQKVLEKLYGSDYMKLPPIEQRECHHPQRIVFEDGEVVDFESEEG